MKQVIIELSVEDELFDDRGKKIDIEEGTFVSINFIGNRDVYTVTSKILALEHREKLRLLLSKPESFNIMGRRAYFRLERGEYERLSREGPVSLKDALSRVKLEIREAGSHSGFQRPVPNEIINLSGGGALLFMPGEMPHLNALLNLSIIIDNSPRYEVIGKVSRVERSRLGEMEGYQVGVEFIEIEESVREKIINFVYEHKKAIEKNC